MAKNLEKQNEKLEKQNKKLKKKNRKGALVIFILLLIILLLFAIIFLFDPFGFGNGMGILKGGTTQAAAASNPASTTAAVTEAAAPAPTYIDVKVSGGTLVCNGEESTPDSIVTAARAVTGDVEVRITDDSATANAMDALTAALDAASIKYTIG